MSEQALREKVIKGLKVCNLNNAAEECDCPYQSSHRSDKCIFELHVDALALLKAQEPRVMTQDDMEKAEPGSVAWCEQRDEIRTYMTPMIKYGDGTYEGRYLGASAQAANLKNTRFWTARPTEEQRKAVEWDDTSGSDCAN